MQQFRRLALALTFSAIAAFAQPKLEFEAASIKPAAPLDMAKMMAAMQGGGKMPVGVMLGTTQAEYIYMDLRLLITFAYGVKPYQITGPDWMATTRFDIVAKYPQGATKADAPKMLQSLLEDRFKLAFHRTEAEHPVLAIVVGKGGPKLKPSTGTPKAIDENEPAPPGMMTTLGPDGPVRMKVNPGGGSIVDMGLKGKMIYTMNPATKTMHIDLSMVTLTGMADMVTQLMTSMGGPGGAGRQIVDMTGIKGNYEASLDISIADLMTMARNAGADIPAAPAGAPASPAVAGEASDPGGGSQSVTEAIQSMGLKLESRKAPIQQLIVDHLEKTPTEN